MGKKTNKKDTTPVRRPRLMEGQEDNNFRRSRTLTGAVSSGVHAAAEDRSQLKSHRLRLHQLRKHRRGLMLSFVAVVVCVLGLGWLITQYIRTPAANISYNRSALQQQADTAAYGQVIEDYFSQHPLERFAFRLNKPQLLAFVQNQYPEVKDITVDVSIDGTQDIGLAFRKPLLSWNTQDSLLFIDGRGVAFDTNYFEQPSVTVEDRTGVEFNQAEVVVSDRFIGFLGQMVGHINKAKVGKVSKVIIPVGTLRQIDVQLQNKPYRIKTHIDRDPYKQARDAVNAVKHLQQKAVTPRYIDVRVEGKAFYRE